MNNFIIGTALTVSGIYSISKNNRIRIYDTRLYDPTIFLREYNREIMYNFFSTNIPCIFAIMTGIYLLTNV